MAKYQQYVEYKDSGIEWLGEIPNHWEVVPIKHLAILNPKKSTLSQDLMFDECSFVPMEKLKFNSLVLDEKKVIKDVYDGYTYFENEDILVAKVTPCFENNNTTIAKDLINGIGFGSSEIFVLRVNDKVNNRYLFYRLLETIFISVATAAMTGAGGLRRVPAETINTYPIAVPDINEQTQIANFLDHETAQIDTLIEKQQTLIQLLKEKRQAVISHAVTKGLNPDAPMKDSGVEWLGEMPEHWDQVKLKHVVDYIIDAEHKTAPYFEQGKYLVCRTTNVRDGELRLEGGKYTNKETYLEWIKRGKPEIGDILFTREAPAGEACVYDGAAPLCLGQRMVLFKLKKDRVLPRFVLHSLYSGLADDFIKQLSQGTTVAHFNMADIRNIPLFEPSLEEQQEIIEYLSKLLNKFDDLVYSAEQAIQLMQERRTALISAAVTGKIDVRGWVAPESR